MLSQKAKYGLLAVLALAREYHQGPVLIARLSASEAIPKKFLELILLELKRHGILQSKMGRGGGYALRRPPRAVTCGEVIRLLDGPLAPIPCVSQTAYQRCPECRDEATCGIRIVMQQVRDETARILDGTTLADVLRRAATAGRRNRRHAPAGRSPARQRRLTHPRKRALRRSARRA